MPTFVHAADLHLDSPLRGLERKEGAPVERIRGASRKAFERLVDAAIEEEVAFVLLAGDIYDTQPAFETYLFFHGQMDRLVRAGIPVAIVLGNHDHGGVAPRAERLPDGVHVFSHDQPTSREIVPGVMVHGQSYPRRDVDTDLSAQYPSPTPGRLNIGMLHTALDGHSGAHARYAPSNTAALAAHGYAYWALGHVHAHVVLEEGSSHIVYPGNLQGRHARETGPKGAVFVDYEGGAIRQVRHREFDDTRWHRLEIDPSGLVDSGDLLDQIVKGVRHQTGDCRTAGRLAAVRLVLKGWAPASLIGLGEEEIRQTLRAKLHGDEAIFLERIEIDLQTLASDRHELDRQLDALAETLTQDPAFLVQAEAAQAEVVKGLRTAGGELAEAFLRENQGSMSPSTGAGALAEFPGALSLVRDLLSKSGRAA